ncbi:jacalin-like lectin domain protein [Rhizoctonia solani 123E]|uniref:Jacalin-like lectin domain protein n=1 Tax=Rhizoctonia solani 123E TaxID=1423351 RepID=A0A074SN85_9AGAM|nr:jacalin-like lectin domain protein [Rhizoctonia solani 123E]
MFSHDHSVLNGVFFDPATGPVTTNRPAATLTTSDTGRVRAIHSSVTEDIILDSELDAHYSQLGWPCPSKLPRPWDIITPRNQRPIRSETWGSRRLMIQELAITISPQDLCPEESLVEAFEAALRQRTNALRIRSLREVFATCGEITLPDSGVALGESNNSYLNNNSTSSNSRSQPYRLTDIVDECLGAASSFTRKLESRVQGGSPQRLLMEGYEAWLKSIIDNPASWRIIKIIHAVPIIVILSPQLRDEIELLFTNSIILRSPSVGAPHTFSFDGNSNILRNIERVTVWFSASRIRDIAVAYTGGIVAGPYSYGLSDHESQSDVFMLAPGEYITDMFVWSHSDGWIMGVQFVKNCPGLSPIYGIRTKDSITSRPPVLLSGNGNVLLALAGAYTSDGLGQLQAVWRSDVVIRRQRHTQTSCVGGATGYVFNDLQYLADPATARIAQITARSGGIHGVAKFQTTYISVSGEALIRSETPPRGFDDGHLSTMTLEDGEYIIGVRGYHNNHGIQRIQFITNIKTHPAFGADTGEIAFGFDAPKTRDGRDMALHYMAGKRLGWPPLNRLPERPWGILTPRESRQLKTEIWASRRLMIQRWTINVSPQDLSPVEPLVEAVKDALSQRSIALRIRALQRVFTIWGEMIPVNVVVGASLATTGTLNDASTLPDSIAFTKASKENRGNLSDMIDQHLGTTRCFLRRLETRIQGGSSDVFLNQGYEAWLPSVAEATALRVVKVNHAVPITEFLDSQLRDRIEKLFINSIILRSPGVGEPFSLGFDGAASGLRNIERIVLWFSDARIRDVSVAYAGGVVTGPYSFGLSNPLSQSDVVVLASGEYITDIFVWQHNDGWIAGIQFVKSSLECSPIYGMPKDGFTSRPPILLSGDGNALLGISGAYTSDSLNQIKAVWRSDVILRRQRHTRTSFTGGPHGTIFNDLQYLADPTTARIVQISACHAGDGTVCNFRVTYESMSGGPVRSETPSRGSCTGPRVTMTLEEGEYITGVRGSHNDGWIFRLQFVTNKRTHPAFGTATGQVPFSFDAPKTSDGRDMVLHYMIGKYRGCLDSLLFVWAEMPLQMTGS